MVWIQIAAWGVGQPILRRLTRNGEQPAAGLRIIFSAALGFTALAYAAFILAALHMLYASVLILITVGAGIWGGIRVVRARPSFRPSLSLHHAPLILAILFLATHVPNALLPILEHDDNVYHLLIPKIYLGNHALVSLPSLLYANMPHLVEVLYTIPMAIGDFVTPKILTLSFSFWIIAALYLATRSSLGRLGAGLIPLLYVSGKNVQWHFGLGYVEPVIGFFLLTACLALLTWSESRNTGYLRVLAVACGFALASKYTAWFFAAAILVVTCVMLIRSQEAGPISRRIRMGAEMASISLLLLAPWLVKNAMFVGNPVYPNLYKMFGGDGWSEIQEMHYLRSQGAVGGARKSILDYLLIPWRLTTIDNFYEAACVSISLLVLWLIAAVRAVARRPGRVAVLAVSTLGLVEWALSIQQGRFLVAWMPVMALAAAPALVPLRDRMRSLLPVFLAVVGVGVLQILVQIYPYRPHTEVFAHSREKLLLGNINYPICAFLNRTVPPEGMVYALWDNRFFFLDRRFHGDSAYEAPTGLAELRAAGDAGIFARGLIRAGYTHVVINTTVASEYLLNQLPFSLLDDRLYPEARLDQDRALVDSFVERYLELTRKFDKIWVYRLRLDPAAGDDVGRPDR